MRIAKEFKNDHQEIRQSFHHINTFVKERGSRRELRALCDELRDRIETHLSCKEICLYRSLMENPETRSIAQDFMDEHSETRDALDDLVDFDVKTFRDLRKRFTTVFAEEESKVFSQLPKVLTEEQDLELVELFYSLRTSKWRQ